MPASPRSIQPEDLFKLRFVREAQLSPNAKHVLYSVSHVDEALQQEFITLWLADLASGQTRSLTHGNHTDTSAQWSPDGQTIAFVSDRCGKPQIFLLPFGPGEAVQLTHMPNGVGGGLAWSPDGRALAFTAGPQHEARNPNAPYRITRNVFRFEQIGFIEDVLQDIYIVDVENKAVRLLVNDSCMKSKPKWSPDGTKILYQAFLPPDAFDQRTMFPGLYSVDLEHNRKTEILPEWGRITAACWLGDSKTIVFEGSPYTPGFSFSIKSDLWSIRLDEAENESALKCHTESLKPGIGNRLQPDMPVWGLFANTILVTNDGKSAFTQVQDGGKLHIYRVALEGPEHYEAVVTGDRSCALIGVNESNNCLLYASSTMNDPLELYRSLLNGSEETQLTHLNDELLSQWLLPEIEHLVFSSPDGVEQEGWFMKPPLGEAPYPTILQIHGGPYGAFGHIYCFDFQLLAGAGYGVLFTNFRGSGGYGSEFSSAITGHWGRVGYIDHIAAVDHAVDLGLADPDRLGVTGLSHGGFATFWIVGHTDRFKAAVPQNGALNWFTSYGLSDAGVWWIVEELGGHPWEIPDIYRERSPITYAHHCKTPTLIIQGEADLRCPPSEGEQFYTVLKVNGCVVEMLRLPNTQHIGSTDGPVPARRAQNEAMLEWFRRYIPI